LFSDTLSQVIELLTSSCPEHTHAPRGDSTFPSRNLSLRRADSCDVCVPPPFFLSLRSPLSSYPLPNPQPALPHPHPIPPFSLHGSLPLRRRGFPPTLRRSRVLQTNLTDFETRLMNETFRPQVCKIGFRARVRVHFFFSPCSRHPFCSSRIFHINRLLVCRVFHLPTRS